MRGRPPARALLQSIADFVFRWKRAILLLVCVGVAGPAFAALGLSTDHRSLPFGIMQLGEEKILAQAGSFQNEITCSSTGGNAWYLKISLIQPLTSGGGEAVPLDAFKWQLTRTDGNGSVVTQSQFRPFSLAPDLVYISGPGEAAGASIHFQFRYSLKVPDAQTTGVYSTTVRFTLTEIL